MNNKVLECFDMRKYNFCKVYIVVNYSEKNEAKKLGALWDSEEKLWYFKWNTSEDFYDKDDTSPLLTKYKIKKIVHNNEYINEDIKQYNKLIEYFNELVLKSRNKKIRCLCRETYKQKHEEKHLKSIIHLDYLKKQEEVDALIDF